MATNVRLTWVLPTPTAAERPLKHVRIEGRVAGAPDFSPIGLPVDAPGTELLLPDVIPGDWEYQGIVVDDLDQESLPPHASVSVTVAADVPQGLQSLKAVLE